MATLLRIDNFPQTNVKELSTLAQDCPAGIASLSFVSAVGYAASDVLFLGNLGSETVERVVIQSVSGQTVTLTTATAFKHLQYEPIYAVKGDQLRIYTAANVDNSQPADTAFALLATVAIDVDNAYTEYNDSAGTAATWYKYTFYNAAGYESLLADSIATRGGGYGHYCSVDDIRQMAGFTRNQNITDSLVDTHRNRAEGEINAELYQVYTLPFAQPIPWLINNIATKLAAGYLLSDEYGTMSRGLSKDGDAMVKEAHEMLMAVKSREQILSDPTGKSLLISQAVTSFPNSTTDTTYDAPRAFSRSKVF